MENPIYFSKPIFLFVITILFFTVGIYYLLKKPRYQDLFAKMFCFIIIVLVCTYGVKHSLQYSDKVWDKDYLEVMLLNSSHTFADKGFSSNYGLPDFSNSYYYRDMANGGKLIKGLSPKNKHLIYTHEPPGSSWILGIFVKACGNSTLSCPRILSTITGSLALLYFFIMIYSALGPLKSSVLIFFVAILPMTRNMIWTLHNHNYSFYLFLILVGFLLNFFKNKRKFKTSTAIFLFILSFVQGWISYEYIFLTCLAPIPFALLYSQLDKKEDRKRLFLAIMFLTMAFLFAAGLHFFQNSLYFGSITEAFNDIFDRLRTRTGDEVPQGWKRKINRISMVLMQFFVMPRSWFFFVINFHILFSLCLVLIFWFNDVCIKIKKPLKISFRWVSPRRNYYVILTAFLASYLWIFVMFNSVANEMPHMSRILFFSYFVCILTILECFRPVVPNDQ